MALAKLTTPQGEALSGAPWQGYPRPQLKRNSYVNLNGTWDFTVTEGTALPESYDKAILVPFCPESALSGIEAHFPDGHSLFYRRQFVLPEDFNRGRVLLHIGAVDQIAEVYVNQKPVGAHVGGYEAFTIDITDGLKDINELVIRVVDDLRSHVLPYGKQVLNRGGMWYTPVSGICCWTIFNEGWGQFDSAPVYRRLKALDSSRFVDTTSGWFRGSESDVESLHIYFGMWHRMKPSKKPIILSEFGGFTHSVPGHVFNPDKSYGYGTCKTAGELNEKLQDIYTKHVIPAVKKGLCASVYTQVSDVEDEINGLLTYDRKVTKPNSAAMQAIAAALRQAIAE